MSKDVAPTADQLLKQATGGGRLHHRHTSGEIVIRGYPIQELIGALSFAQMGADAARRSAGPAQAKLLGGCFGCRGRPRSTGAIDRDIALAVTCGLPINGAMASAINALDDIHGGAGPSAWSYIKPLLNEPIRARVKRGRRARTGRFIAERGKIVAVSAIGFIASIREL